MTKNADTYYFETSELLQFQFLKYFEWKTQEAGYLIPGIGTGQMSMLVRIIRTLNADVIIATVSDYLVNLKTTRPNWWGILNRLENNPVDKPRVEKSWRQYVLEATRIITGQDISPEECSEDTRKIIQARAHKLKELECGEK